IDAVVPAMAALLTGGNEPAKAVRTGTGALFIDEFQDLNQSQYAVVRLLAESSPVFAIGDPDQAIYGFRGSSPSWFYRFLEDVHPQPYSLYRNYRCGSTIVEAANHLIGHNYHPGPVMNNDSCTGIRGEIFLHQADSPRQEAGFIVRQIEELMGGTTHREINRLHDGVGREDVSLRDIAVLYRTSRQADILASGLFDHGFPVQVVDVRPYYLNKPLRSLYLWTLLLSRQADTAHLMMLLQDVSGVAKTSLHELEQLLPLTTVDVLAEVAANKDSLSGPLKKIIEEMVGLGGKALQAAAEKGVAAALQMLASCCKIDEGEPDLARFYLLAENFGASLDGFAHHLLLHHDSIVYDKRAEAISLMTLHASKGLQFKVVFIVGLEEGLLPLQSRHGDSNAADARHLEEERRLFYVGMTRAEEVLYLSHVRKRKGGGEEVLSRSSRFLREIPADLMISLENRSNKRVQHTKIHQLNLFEKI
ncbi:MAG: ATP-dependent helicase, partial [Desulfobulbaceae bacterium]|nr:ATP-dependent helicase [Desulfobulbaceae bacterium]